MYYKKILEDKMYIFHWIIKEFKKGIFYMILFDCHRQIPINNINIFYLFNSSIDLGHIIYTSIRYWKV